MEERGSGWIGFAAIVLMVAGVMRIIDGIWALRFSGPGAGGLQDGLVGEKLDNYGWFWMLIGVMLILAGLAVFQRSQLARWIGIIAGAIAAISALAWIPYYPVWSLIYVGVGFGVIYGLSVYGGPETSEV